MGKRYLNLLSFKYVLGIVLLAVFMAGFMSNADASHYRYGHLNWKKTGTSTVEFGGAQAWRGNVFGAVPNVGNLVEILSETLTFGDGSPGTSIYIKVTSVNIAENWFLGNIVNSSGNPITHSYSSNGPFTAFWDNCCRIGSLQNNANGSYRVETKVDLSGNTSPVSTMVPIKTIFKNFNNTFTFYPACR